MFALRLFFCGSIIVSWLFWFWSPVPVQPSARRKLISSRTLNYTQSLVRGRPRISLSAVADLGFCEEGARWERPPSPSLLSVFFLPFSTHPCFLFLLIPYPSACTLSLVLSLPFFLLFPTRPPSIKRPPNPSKRSEERYTLPSGTRDGTKASAAFFCDILSLGIVSWGVS